MPSADAIAFSEMDRLPPAADDVGDGGGAGHAGEPRTGEHGAPHEELVQVPLAPRQRRVIMLQRSFASQESKRIRI